MADSATHADVKASIVQYLTSKNLPPSAAWLREFMPTVRLNNPILALQKTALFRLLSSDLTVSIDAPAGSAFPPNIAAAETKELKLKGPIAVQVLDIEDIGHSRWSQVESIEAVERGEMTKGREIIRVVDDEANTDPNHTQANDSAASSGPHNLLLQDAKGTKVYAFEMSVVSGVGVQQMSIGAKLVLKDVAVARGVLMLEPRGVDLLGGKVEAWDKKWRSERKEVLKRKAGMSEGAGG